MLAEDLLAHVREDLLAGGAAPLGRAGAAAGAVVASAECDGKRVGRFRVADVLRTDDQAGQELFAGGNDHAHGRDEAVRVLVGVPAAALDGHGVLDARAAVGPVGDVAAFWRGITERGLVQIRKELCIYILIYIYVYIYIYICMCTYKKNTRLAVYIGMCKYKTNTRLAALLLWQFQCRVYCVLLLRCWLFCSIVISWSTATPFVQCL